MTTYAVQAGGLSRAIYVGRVNKAGTAFTSKDDLTDEVLLAVVDYVRRHFNGDMEMTFHADNQPTIHLTITAREEHDDE